VRAGMAHGASCPRCTANHAIPVAGAEIASLRTRLQAAVDKAKEVQTENSHLLIKQRTLTHELENATAAVSASS